MILICVWFKSARHFHMLGKAQKTASDSKWMIAQINFASLDVRWFGIVSENLRLFSRATSTDRGMPWILCLLAELNKYMKCICSQLILFWPRVQRTTIDKGGKAQRKHCCRLSHSSKFASCASSNRDFSKVLNFCAKLKGCALQLFLFSELSIFLRNARNWICWQVQDLRDFFNNDWSKGIHFITGRFIYTILP